MTPGERRERFGALYIRADTPRWVVSAFNFAGLIITPLELLLLWPLELVAWAMGPAVPWTKQLVEANPKFVVLQRTMLLFSLSSFVWFLVLLGINFQVWNTVLPYVRDLLK